ncbi:hypothetical protein ACJX0J_036660 [Zea mays]
MTTCCFMYWSFNRTQQNRTGTSVTSSLKGPGEEIKIPLCAVDVHKLCHVLRLPVPHADMITCVIIDLSVIVRKYDIIIINWYKLTMFRCNKIEASLECFIGSEINNLSSLVSNTQATTLALEGLLDYIYENNGQGTHCDKMMK